MEVDCMWETVALDVKKTISVSQCQPKLLLLLTSALFLLFILFKANALQSKKKKKSLCLL